MNYVAAFFAGAFPCNTLPHLLCGLQGQPFSTPFAKPPGKGDSSTLMNFLWGSLNLAVGIDLLIGEPVTVGFTSDFAALSAGFLVIGMMTSLHFGNVRKNRTVK
jgi:hypothetical protein